MFCYHNYKVKEKKKTFLSIIQNSVDIVDIIVITNN